MKAVLLLVAFTAVLIQNTMCEIVGGEEEANISEEEKSRLVNLSLDAFHKVSNSTYQSKVVCVNDIKQQTVAGTLYKLNLDFGETTCQKGNAGNDCELRNSGTVNCAVEVYERSWDNFIEAKVISCFPPGSLA